MKGFGNLPDRDGRKQWWEQDSHGHRVTYELLEDVMPAMEKTYRTAAGRENRAVVGLSMGGGQALQIGLGHLVLFSHVGAFSSAIPGDFSTRF